MADDNETTQGGETKKGGTKRAPRRRSAASPPPASAPSTPADGTESDAAALAALDLDLEGGVGDYTDSERDGAEERRAGFNSAKERITNEAVVGDQNVYEVGEAGSKALQGQFESGRIQPADDWLRVICMRMGRPGKHTAALHGWGAFGIDVLKFNPFAISPPLHPRLVASITKPREERRYGTPWMDYWLAPPTVMVDERTGKPLPGGERGDCKGEQSFFDPISGQRIQTCIYGDCPRHPMPDGISHSIWMAQRFIALLKSDSVIRAYIRNFDPRPEVGHFAQLVIAQRQQSIMEAMGTGATGQPDLVF